MMRCRWFWLNLLVLFGFVVSGCCLLDGDDESTDWSFEDERQPPAAKLPPVESEK